MGDRGRARERERIDLFLNENFLHLILVILFAMLTGWLYSCVCSGSEVREIE